MVMIALSSSLIGAVLGTQYKVPVLFPAAVVGAAIVAVVAAFIGRASRGDDERTRHLGRLPAARIPGRPSHPLLS